MQRTILIATCRAGNAFNAYAPEFPGCMAAGDTREEARQKLTNALEWHIKAMLADGEPLPPADAEYAFIKLNTPDSPNATNGTLVDSRDLHEVTS